MNNNKDMKLIRTLDVGNDEFYDYLEKSLIPELNTAAVSIKKKKSGPVEQTGVHAKIDQLIRGKQCQITSRTAIDSITVIFLTEALNNKIKVTMIETINSYHPADHNKIVNWLSELILLGRMSNMLQTLEQHIIAQRITAA